MLSKQKCTDYTEKLPFMDIFPYNLYILVYIQHALANMVFIFDLSNSVKKGCGVCITG